MGAEMARKKKRKRGKTSGKRDGGRRKNGEGGKTSLIFI